MTLPFEVTLVDGPPCDVTETDCVVVVLHASVSSPPGSTLAFVLAGITSPYRVKVRGCRKLPDIGPRSFRIDGRFFDMTREQRKALQASCR